MGHACAVNCTTGAALIFLKPAASTETAVRCYCCWSTPLIETGSRISVAAGYVLGAALMLAASIIAARFCVPAERKPLEVVAPPLSAVGSLKSTDGI